MKKNFHQRLQASRLGRMCLLLCGPASKAERASIYQEMEHGAVIGFFASSLLAIHFAAEDLSAALLIIVSSLGLLVGAVIGAILWISGAELPEDAVRAPAPGQDRSKNVR